MLPSKVGTEGGRHSFPSPSRKAEESESPEATSQKADFAVRSHVQASPKRTRRKRGVGGRSANWERQHSHGDAKHSAGDAASDGSDRGCAGWGPGLRRGRFAGSAGV